MIIGILSLFAVVTLVIFFAAIIIGILVWVVVSIVENIRDLLIRSGR